MALIDASYFFGELNIAQKSEATGSLTMFIDEHESQLLDDLLGYELARDFKAAIAITDPVPEAKWTDLRDGKEYTNRTGTLTKWKGLKFTIGTAKKSLIANYVYWHWIKDNATISTGSGEKKSTNQAAIIASEAEKMVRAWNQMVTWNWELVEFLLSNSTDYSPFSNHYSSLVMKSILKRQNVLGI